METVALKSIEDLRQYSLALASREVMDEPLVRALQSAKQLTWLSVIAFIFLYCNLGSVCSHCLYNAATGWSRILGSRMRLLAIALGVIGIIVAAGNVWAFFIEWLTLLGILVPPIGAIILVDQYMLRVNSEATVEWRPVAFVAWAAGSIVAFFVSEMAPEYSTAIAAFVVAAVVYGVLQSVMARRSEYA